MLTTVKVDRQIFEIIFQNSSNIDHVMIYIYSYA